MTAVNFSSQLALEQVSQRLRSIRDELNLLRQQERTASKFSPVKSRPENGCYDLSHRIQQLAHEQDELSRLSSSLFTQF